MRGRGGLGSLGGPRWDFDGSEIDLKILSKGFWSIWNLPQNSFLRVNISAAPQDRVHSETSTEVIRKSIDCAATKKNYAKTFGKRLFMLIQSEIHSAGPWPCIPFNPARWRGRVCLSAGRQESGSYSVHTGWWDDLCWNPNENTEIIYSLSQVQNRVFKDSLIDVKKGCPIPPSHLLLLTSKL